MPSKKAVNSLTTDVKEYLKIRWQMCYSNDGNEIHEKEGLFESIIKKFMSFETVSKNYTDIDVEGLLHLSIVFKKPPFEITDEFVENVVNSFFENTAEDYVYVPLEDLAGFPSNYKIGACNIITSEEVPHGIKHTILLAEKNISSESSLPKYWIYTKLDSIGQMKQQEEIFYKIDEALSILRIDSVGTGFSCPLFIRNYHIYNSKSRMHRTSSYVIQPSFPYWEGLNKTIKDYAILFYKERKSPIESAVINALKIYSLHINTTSINVKFNLVMFALEGLLLTENDLNYLGKRLGEKAAFLTEKNSTDKRKEIYREMKAMYSKRSNFVHQKKNPKKSDKITSDNLVFIREIFLRCVEEILSLEKNGTITRLASDGSQDDNKSLDYYIENLIFS